MKLKNRNLFAMLLLAGVIVAVLTFPACKSKKQEALKTTPKPLLTLTGENKNLNVVVIVIDTLRADRLPFYGYQKNTAPFLSTLAAKGVVFDYAISASSTTAPSTASIFTSLYPSEHGIITGYIATEKLQKEHPKLSMNRIPAEVTTLGELFKNAGYKTFSVSDNLNISKEMGYDPGFDYFKTFKYEGAPVINKTLKEWEPEAKKGGPYFMYIQYMDPHEPYNKQKPWYEKADTKRQRTKNAYDSEINYTDKAIQEMFELFQWEKNSVVIVTSDHGEEFWDHGKLGHGKSLYTEVIQVPLMIYHPSMKLGKRVDSFVSTMDIIPTVAEMAGIPAEKVWKGRSLMPLMEAGHLPQKLLFSELLRRDEHKRDPRQSVVFRGMHYIHTVPRKGKEYGELYNLKLDLTEMNNLVSKIPDLAKEGYLNLDRFNKKDVEVQQEEVEITVNEDTLEHLKSLGYMQ